MVAAAILLDGGVAHRALRSEHTRSHTDRETETLTDIFGIGEDVVCSLRVILALGKPLAKTLTVSWKVVGLTTVEAGIWREH